MEQSLFVRINGVSSGSIPSGTCTSCSIVSLEKEIFHILVGTGPGVEASLKQGVQELKVGGAGPDAILITHAHSDQVSELPQFISGESHPKIFCTQECAGEIIKQFPSLSSHLLPIVPGKTLGLGPFSVLPIQADHTSDLGTSPGAAIYVIKRGEYKVICGWDFLKLHAVDNSVFWNPDLLILGTETYNDHPSTGIISVSEAYNIIRRWNARECFIVGYNGQKDAEDAKNQWFRGPTRPLSPDELQRAIDEHLRVSGSGGKFLIKVAQQGMLWKPLHNLSSQVDRDIGDTLEIEGIEKYLLKLEKTPAGVRVTVEDSINRLESDFVQPRPSGGGRELAAGAVKGFMAKGPELRMAIIPQEPVSVVKLGIAKGKKSLVKDDIQINPTSAERLIKFINHHHFTSPAEAVTTQ